MRDIVAEAIRDWIHEQPFSKCNAGSDTCPDWDLAYELTDLIMKRFDVIYKRRGGLRGASGPIG